MADDAVPSDDFPLESLTWREHEILSLLAEHKTNREIGAALNIEPTTVKWYNTQIYGKLGVKNRREAAAAAKALGLLDEPSKPVAPPPQNLPAPVTSFVGRVAELAQLTGLLGEPAIRLLTLTGPPGTGKTRLAREAASRLLDRFKDGVCFVALAPISDSSLVASLIAESLGVQQSPTQSLTETLKRALREKQLLLLLDNYEHVLEAAPLVSELLAATPYLKVMVTSREVLHLYGEHVFPVPPLTLPDLKHLEPPSALARYEATALFVDRARAADMGIQFSGENARAAAEICVRLDGLPLAIELVASRVRLLSPHALLGKLEDRLEAVKDGMLDLHPRHRTLRATIGWSYDLLDEDEQRLFARLAVFHGGCTLEAAAAVCGDSLAADVSAGLESLLNKNLLQREDGSDGEPRFVMLETIREYARERLEQSGEAVTVQRRHADYFVALAERAETHLLGENQGYWYAKLAAEHDNIRAALAWSLDSGEAEPGLRMAGALWRFWYYQGYVPEGTGWVERLLALENAGAASPEARARALLSGGTLAFFLPASYEQQGEDWCREALQLAQELEETALAARAMIRLAGFLVKKPDTYEEGMAFVEQSLALYQQLDDSAGVAFALNTTGELARERGDYVKAATAYEEFLRLVRQLGDRSRETVALLNLAYVTQQQGDSARAEALSREGLTLSRNLGSEPMAVGFLIALAGPASATDRLKRAARLLGAARALNEKLGLAENPADQIEFERYLAATREQLDETAFESAWGEGRAMSYQRAAAYALGQEAD